MSWFFFYQVIFMRSASAASAFPQVEIEPIRLLFGEKPPVVHLECKAKTDTWLRGIETKAIVEVQQVEYRAGFRDAHDSGSAFSSLGSIPASS
jgi:hypothetical protein